MRKRAEREREREGKGREGKGREGKRGIERVEENKRLILKTSFLFCDLFCLVLFPLFFVCFWFLLKRYLSFLFFFSSLPLFHYLVFAKPAFCNALVAAWIIQRNLWGPK